MRVAGRSFARWRLLSALVPLALPLVLAACNNGSGGPGY